MNPGVYEGLQFDKVLNTIRENLRGTTPEALATSKYVPEFAEKIAKVYSCNIEKVAEVTTKNAKSLFKIWRKYY